MSRKQPLGLSGLGDFTRVIRQLFLIAFASAGITAAAQPVDHLPNAFFAMNFESQDPKIAHSRQAQAALLKELGYDGSLYLGPIAGLREALQVMETNGLTMFAAAVHPYNIFVDPGETIPENLKEAVWELKGRKTQLLIQFQSKKLQHSSAEGDARAVELGRELADYAREHGVRVVIYPHRNIWCERVDHAVRIARQCRRENLGVCFNLAHWLWTDPKGDLDVLVKETMPHLFLVTIHGSSPEGSYETLDRGAYDMSAFLRRFIVAGYGGPIGLQCVSVPGDARENLTRSMAAWKKISVELGREQSHQTQKRNSR